MNNFCKYKSHLVVWNHDEVPVIETFHADTMEEIGDKQRKWMEENGYTIAHVSLSERRENEWVSIEKCEFRRMPDIPEFAVLQFLKEECSESNGFLEGMVIQIPTGRIVRIALADKGYNDGIITSNLIYDYEDRELRYKAALVTLAEEDRYMIEDGEIDELRTFLSEDLFTPLARWFMKKLEIIYKNKRPDNKF